MSGPDAEEAVGAVQLDLGAEDGAGRLRLPAREAGVAVARQFVIGMGDVLHVGDHMCEDLKLAATEACTNAVLHAYPGGDAGTVEVELSAAGDHLVMTIRDQGEGPPGEDRLEEADGYGFSLIEAVSDDFRLDPADGGGTQVRMTFRGARTTPDEPLDALHSPVLRRVVAMMAAHAGFSMDRLSDAVLVAETLAAHAPSHCTDGVVRVVVEDRSRDVVLRIGPLVTNGAGGLLDSSRLPAYGGVLEHLADEVESECDGIAEYLVVRMAARQ